MSRGAVFRGAVFRGAVSRGAAACLVALLAAGAVAGCGVKAQDQPEILRSPPAPPTATPTATERPTASPSSTPAAGRTP